MQLFVSPPMARVGFSPSQQKLDCVNKSQYSEDIEGNRLQ